MSTDVAAMLCVVAGALDMTPLVRIPEREYGMIGRLLDGGAHGVVAPRIETVEERGLSLGRVVSLPVVSGHRRRWSHNSACARPPPTR